MMYYSVSDTGIIGKKIRVLHGTNILHTARIGMSCVAYAQWNKCDGIFLSLVNK